MAVTENTRFYVQPPSPVVPRYGLFQVATGPLAMPVHARQGGVEYELGTCAVPYGYETTCDHDDLETKTFTADAISTIDADPFVVVASLACGSLGMDEQRYRTLLMDQLRANEQATVENIFSDGLFGQAPSLANNTPNSTLLTAVASIVAGVAALENWLYTTKGVGWPGVIHVPAIAAASMMSNVLVWKDGPVWKTGMGTSVSFGNYSGKKPDGSSPAAGHTTLYISGPVTIWRTPDSDVFMTPIEAALNRTTNQINALVEREYIVTYDCFAAGVDVTL